MDKDEVKALVDSYGGPVKLAELLPVSRQTVYTWLKTGIPARTWPWVKERLSQDRANAVTPANGCR